MTSFTQPTGKDATQEIDTPSATYVRYTTIATTQKDAQGQALNFKPLVNVWGKSSSSTTDQLYNQRILGIFPVAGLSSKNRSALLTAMEQSELYGIDFSKTTRSGA